MAPLNKSTGIRKIDLSEIILSENIRIDYNEIEELAASIEREGQLQPVVISPEYELIAGYRRYHAHKYLVDQGKPFNQIEAKIHTGDIAILQLTENIHRDNLSPIELEKALKKMIDSGLTQKDISERLNKRLTWVSDSLAANEVREKVTVDTSGISTTAMGQLRSVPDDDLDFVVEKVKKNGGTVSAAKNAVGNVDPFKNIKREAIRLENSGYDYQEIIEEIGEVLLS